MATNKTPSKKVPLDSRLFARGLRELGEGLSALAGSGHLWAGLPGEGKVKVLRDVPYTQRGGKQAVDVFLPAKARDDGRAHPFIFFIHGGGWIMGDRKMGAVMGRLLASRGIAVVSAGYRLAPGFGLSEQLDDLQSALELVHRKAGEWGLDEKHYAISGESAGGHLTLRLAQEFPDNIRKPRAVIGIYGIYDMESWRQVRSLRRRAVVRLFLNTVRKGDPTEHFIARHHAHRELPWRDVPVLLLHGEADGLVPVAQSHKLAKLLRAQGVRVTLKTFPGVGHGFNYSPRGKGRVQAIEFYKTVFGFFQKHVAAQTEGKAA